MTDLDALGSRNGDLANNALVLELIHSLGVTTRSRLGKLAHMSPSAVSKAVRQLMDAGFVEERSTEPSTGGRPAVQLVLRPQARFAIGAEWSIEKLKVTLTDLYASQLRSYEAYPSTLRPDDITDKLCGLILQALDEADAERVVGVGVAVPGVANSAGKEIEFFSELSLRKYPIGEKVRAATGFAPAVHNRVMASAMGEIWQGDGRGAQSLVYVSIGTIIGGGLVLQGHPYKGASVAMSEIGHITVVRDGQLCFCGNRGCLYTVASSTAIESHVRERLKSGKPSSLPQVVEGNLDLINSDMILEAAQAGDQLSIEVIEEAADYIGIAVGNVINLLSPEVFVVGGPLPESHPELWMKVIRSAVRRHSLSWPMSRTRILPGRLGNDSRAVGAAALAVSDWLQTQSPLYPRDIVHVREHRLTQLV